MGKMAKEECVEIRQEGLGWSPKNINILEIRRGVEPIKRIVVREVGEKLKDCGTNPLERASGRKTWSTTPNAAKRRIEW